MHYSVPRIARRGLAAVVAMAVVAAGLLGSGTPATARPVYPFLVKHAASGESDVLPRGGMLIIETPSRVTDLPAQVFDPWTPTAPDGLYVEASCSGYADMMRLPITAIGEHGFGNAITVYYPNAVGPEPWGACANSGDGVVRVYPAPGYGSRMERNVVTVPAHPGLFGLTAPKGSHVDGQTGAPTALADCLTIAPRDPSQCRPRTAGQPAELLLPVTGADYAVECCGGGEGDVVRVSLAAMQGVVVVGAEVFQDLVSITRINTGMEQMRIRLLPDTASGQYRIRTWSAFSGYAIQDLTVYFGAPS